MFVLTRERISVCLPLRRRERRLLVMMAPVLFAGWIMVVTAVLMLHNEFVKRYGPMLKERYPQFFVRVHGKPFTFERGLSKLKVYIGIVMTVAQDRTQILITLRRQVRALRPGPSPHQGACWDTGSIGPSNSIAVDAQVARHLVRRYALVEV